MSCVIAAFGLAPNAWISEQRRANLPYNPYNPSASCYDEVWLSGRATFETTRRLLNSTCDMRDMRLGLPETHPIISLGVHDVVFYRGVLYHVENPFETLRKLASLTRGNVVRHIWSKQRRIL